MTDSLTITSITDVLDNKASGTNFLPLYSIPKTTSLAKVDFKNETASVLFDLNKIDKDILKSTVESIGDKKTYKVENIKISL